jgi:hypothetical protein
MICIRENIFETNSSSTHSVCVNFKKLINIDSFDNLVIEGNKCIITAINQMDDFDKWQVRGERDKLNYLFTWMYLRDNGPVMNGSHVFTRDSVSWPEPYGGIETGIYEEEYRNLLSVIQKKYPNVEGISFLNPKNAEFDHQTSPWEEDFIIDLNDSNEIYNYLFNDHLYIQIGHD